jgi:hypothetical protein
MLIGWQGSGRNEVMDSSSPNKSVNADRLFRWRYKAGRLR